MKLENYVAGQYKNGNGYKAFLPSKINYNWGWDDTKLNALLAEASIASKPSETISVATLFTIFCVS